MWNQRRSSSLNLLLGICLPSSLRVVTCLIWNRVVLKESHNLLYILPIDLFPDYELISSFMRVASIVIRQESVHSIPHVNMEDMIISALIKKSISFVLWSRLSSSPTPFHPWRYHISVLLPFLTIIFPHISLSRVLNLTQSDLPILLAFSLLQLFQLRQFVHLHIAALTQSSCLDLSLVVPQSISLYSPLEVSGKRSNLIVLTTSNDVTQMVFLDWPNCLRVGKDLGALAFPPNSYCAILWPWH